MPADMNDYFKKKKPSSGGENGGGNNKPNSNFPNKFENTKGKFATTIITIIFIGFLAITLKPFTIVNSGEVGIKVTTGKFSETPLKAGLHLYFPIFQKIYIVNTKIKMITYSNNARTAIGDGNRYEGGLRRNESILVLDKRGLNVQIELAVQYRLRAESAPATIEKWGDSWEEKIINSTVREVVRDVIGQYTAEQLPEMRNEIAKAIQTKVKSSIEGLDGEPVKLSSVQLRNIELPKKIREQIERVQIAKQEVTVAEQQKEKAKQDAQRKAEIAKGEAQRNRIEAQGEADKVRIEAEEQAKANKLIAQSLTPELLQLKQIETQMKFNEALKVNTNAQIFLTPGGAVPNIWVDSKTNGKNIIQRSTVGNNE
ncbi:Membrane protease family protein HP0248 [hydrothermal vent metagenome]|uniref:Membrane protease family protein HP0248 n=1 Tax=hydrothermal vent metagenome TaxID=652676 RepID=A0A1W1EK36_9ZZZZ